MVRQSEELTEMVAHSGSSRGQGEEISKTGGLWELGGESGASQGLCRSRLD